VDMTQVAVFTTLHFPHNLRMGPISQSVLPDKPFLPDLVKHSNLLDLFESYEENDVL